MSDFEDEEGVDEPELEDDNEEEELDEEVQKQFLLQLSTVGT